MNLMREITRLRSVSSSPVIQNFSEACTGTLPIRSYEKIDISFREYIRNQDEFMKNDLTLAGVGVWFTIRIALWSLVVALPAIMICVSYHPSNLLAICQEQQCWTLRSPSQLHPSANNSDPERSSSYLCPGEQYDLFGKMHILHQRRT